MHLTAGTCSSIGTINTHVFYLLLY